MKTVMKASEVIAAYIAQDQDFARTPYNQAGKSSIYFEKRRLFSYGSHYVMARLTVDNVAFVNGQSSSVTTNKHMHNASHKLREAGKQVIRIDNIMAASFDEHMANVIAMREERKSIRAKLARARSESMKEHYSNMITRSQDTAESYLNWIYVNVSKIDNIIAA